LKNEKYDAVVCGAGISGIASAYYLIKSGLERVLLIDQGPPLSLTSDKSAECFRNWWSGPDDTMVAFMNRSIDLLEQHAEESKNRFLLNPHGYLFATASTSMIDVFEEQGKQAENFGAGCFRNITNNSEYIAHPNTGYISELNGSDLITGRSNIQELFPYLNQDTLAVLHARRCGSLSAQQLGMYLLEEARKLGCEFRTAYMKGIDTETGSVSSIIIESKGVEQVVESDAVVICGGPHINATLKSIDIELPILVEKHVKISLPDTLGVMPRNAPLVVWADPIRLNWSKEEAEELKKYSETEWLLQEFPAGVHGRPLGAGNQVLMYWTYDCKTTEIPSFPIEWNEYLPEVTLRGMSHMIPELKQYLEPMPKPYVDGGYYTKTPENRPLIGSLGIPGAFVCGAFSGFGIMSACASGELISKHVTNGVLPSYSKSFDPMRFNDSGYLAEIKTWNSSGQL
jgi:glycine/D-amino acid oxidase-like deaminating enzyme